MNKFRTFHPLVKFMRGTGERTESFLVPDLVPNLGRNSDERGSVVWKRSAGTNKGQQQNIKAFLTRASRRDHISAVLRSLHWLPVNQRVDYKLATLVYKSLQGQTAPGRRLPADRGFRTPPASLRSRQRPHCSENKHSTWRQEFLGCGSENLEQSTRLTAAAWHWIWTL